ncbi:MAG: Stigma-specific protein Stig1, partial [Pseudomonadota bacterium]
MTRFDVRAYVVVSTLAATALFTSSGCGSSLVGLSCKDGYSECGSVCVDLRADPQHCGSCAVSCSAEEACRDSACMPADQV